MLGFYLIPILTVGVWRGPSYFVWKENPVGIDCQWAMMDYGFSPYALLVATDIEPLGHNWLITQPGVFDFPPDLDTPVDQDIQAFFEDVHLPTDWLTPATTWRELLRQVAGMFQFNQRYMGIVANETSERHSIFDTATLDTRLRQMTVDEQRWFLETVESFGFDPALVNVNSRLRLLVKQAAIYWEGQPFYLGGLEF